MPTHDRKAALSADEARARVARLCFEPAGGAQAGNAEPGPAGANPVEANLVGLEPELFAYYVRPDRTAGDRVPLESTDGRPGVLDVLDDLCRSEPGLRRTESRPGHAPSFEINLEGAEVGGRLTFEPGAQIEHSTAPYSTGARALAGTHDVFCLLQRTFGAHGIALVSTGVDLWHTDRDVAQQLRAPRYCAMAEYFDRRSEHGRTMMRLSASQQVNLDLGTGRTRDERWLAAYLAGPLATASFATSPREGWVNARARAWQGLDPTRTGHPPALVDGSLERPEEQYADAALRADVMLLVTPEGAVAGTPGWTFGDWMRDGHPDLGWPTADDLDYHLTTLFFEVRPRGFFEIRTTDALPAPWLTAPVVLWCGLLYDDRARGEALEALDGSRAELPARWELAARRGLSDAELARQATHTWNVALEGAGRLGPDFFSDGCLATAESFLETFTRRGRSPSDELLGILQLDPVRALDWAIGEADCPSAADPSAAGHLSV